MGRWAAGFALAVLLGCGSGTTSTSVTSNGETKSIPCPGSGCVGGFFFICDSDGNVTHGLRCGLDGGLDGGAEGGLDASTDAH